MKQIMGLWVSGGGQIFNLSTQIEVSLTHKELQDSHCYIEKFCLEKQKNILCKSLFPDIPRDYFIFLLS